MTTTTTQFQIRRPIQTREPNQFTGSLIVEIADLPETITVNRRTFKVSTSVVFSNPLDRHAIASINLIGPRGGQGCLFLFNEGWKLCTGWNQREFAFGTDRNDSPIGAY